MTRPILMLKMSLGSGWSQEWKQNSICDTFNTKVNRFVISILYNAFYTEYLQEFPDLMIGDFWNFCLMEKLEAFSVRIKKN